MTPHNNHIERVDQITQAMHTYIKSIMADDTVQRSIGNGLVSNFWYTIGLALKAHQSWFRISEVSSEVLFFPFAWYLDRGMKIYNDTTRAQYDVVAVNKIPYTATSGYKVLLPSVVLTGGEMPKSTDRLRFDDDHYLHYVPEEVRSFAGNAQYNNEQRDVAGVFRDTITYELIRRENGSIGAKPFGSSRERAPRLREQRIDNVSNQSLSFLGQCYDNLAQFNCYTTDTTRADSLADYFEQFVKLWTPSIVLNSASRLWFWGRGRDVIDTTGRNAVTARSLQYYFRTEEVMVQTDYLIQSVSLAVQTVSTNDLLAAVTGSTDATTGVTGLFSAKLNETY